MRPSSSMRKSWEDKYEKRRGVFRTGSYVERWQNQFVTSEIWKDGRAPLIR